MIDLLEEMRLAIERERGDLTDAQVLVVLIELVQDFSGNAWIQLSE